jgi:tetratricopeptide (TPR) repeat protein
VSVDVSRLDQIEKLLAAEPQDLFLNFSLAMEYVKLGRPDDAIAQFARVIELDGDYVAAYFQQANTLVAMNRVEDARASLNAGIEAARRIGDDHAVGEMSDALALLP